MTFKGAFHPKLFCDAQSHKSHFARKAKEAEQEAGSRTSSLSTLEQKRFLQEVH